MSGREKTIKTPKMVENIKKFSYHNIKGSSRSFPDSLMYAFIYSVNKIVKQEIKMTKIWVKVPKFLKFCISNVNQNQKNP